MKMKVLPYFVLSLVFSVNSLVAKELSSEEQTDAEKHIIKKATELANTLVTDDSSDLLLANIQQELAEQQIELLDKRQTRQINRPVEIANGLFNFTPMPQDFIFSCGLMSLPEQAAKVLFTMELFKQTEKWVPINGSPTTTSYWRVSF
jgi:hypothetical protein